MIAEELSVEREN